MYSVPGLGEVASTTTSWTEIVVDSIFPLGYWRDLWSSQEFAGLLLKDCVNVIHTDIVEIWNLEDRAKVSSSCLSTVLTTHRY